MRADLICWDSSVLISWLEGDSAKPERIQSIRAVIRNVETGVCRLAFSTLIYVEVLESKLPDDAIEKFRRFMQNREQVEIIAVDIRVAERSQKIRNHTRITTPDAVHIATAIVSGAKFFHTFDEQLLKLSGKSEVDNLAITACHIPGTTASLL